MLNLLAQLRRPETDNIFLVITHLGSAPVVWTAVVVAIALSLHGRQYKSTFVIAGSVVLSVLLSQMLKFGYGRERPDVSLRMVAALGYSFPSGHSAVSFAFFGALYYWLWNHPGIFRLRVFLAFVVILTSLLIGFSRMYLGVHYPSDVVAGFCLGLASVIFCATVAANWESLTDVPRRADWATCATVCFQIGGAILYAKMHAIKPPAEYVQNVTPRAFESMDDLLKVIPDHSSTLLGQRQLPVTIVGIGSQDELTTHLRALQWKSNRASDFFTRQLSSPVFPAFVNSKPALVTMENRTSTTRTILRAWDLPYTLQGRKVWLGAITMERLQKRWREFRVFRVDPDQDFCLNSFRESLTTAPLSVEIMPHFRERGLYNWNHEFFTHGMGLTILGE